MAYTVFFGNLAASRGSFADGWTRFYIFIFRLGALWVFCRFLFRLGRIRIVCLGFGRDVFFLLSLLAFGRLIRPKRQARLDETAQQEQQPMQPTQQEPAARQTGS